MTILTLLGDLDNRGIRLAVTPAGGLDIDAPRDALTPELLDLIRQHKPELLRLLATPQPLGDLQPTDDHADDWREFTTADRHGIERTDAPRHIDWDGNTAKPATARPTPQPAADWPAALADFVLLLCPDDLPEAPFSPRPAATVTDPAKYLAALQAEIRRGPAGPRTRYGALQDDLRRLADIVTSDADRRQTHPVGRPTHRHDLQAQRRNAVQRFQRAAQAILAEAGVAVVEYHDSGLCGRAWAKEKRVRIPRPTTRRRLYIVAHEAGHVARNHAGGVSHRQEYEAELYAHDALRRHGVAVPRKESQRARRYVAHKIHQAIRRGAKRIDPEALAWCRECWTPATMEWVRTQDDQQPKRPAQRKRQRQTKPRTMTIERRGAEWWIAGCEPFTVDGETCDTMGPYTTRAEAADDLRGLRRTLLDG